MVEGTDYKVVDCDPELADTAAFCQAYGYSPDESANAIVVEAKSDPPRHVLCLVLATTRLDVNRTVRKRLAVRKCSFASAETTRNVTGMEIGGVTPFGSGLEVWIDAEVMERELLIIGGGSRHRKLLVPPATLRARPDVEVIEGLARPAS